MKQTYQRPADTWSPLYFLASIGAGGLAVTFFMFLLFWVPHPGQPVPVFEDIAAAFGSGTMISKAMIVIAAAGIATFAFLNIKLLVWNLRQLAAFKSTDAYQKLLNSNAETQLLAMPLALAMTVNASFIVGLVFVPGLWSVVEFLFPAAMVVFAAISVLAFRLLGRFLGRVLSQGNRFDMDANNSFAQLLPAFAFIMAAVGMSAPAAMSTVPTTVGISLIASLALGTIAIFYALVAGIVAVPAMLKNGVAGEGAPTLMIIVPLLTIIGIMTMRQEHGLHTTFDAHGGIADNLLLTTTILALQFAFLAIGYVVLKKQSYADRFLRGEGRSAGSYALVCPGVALSVMLHFWINKGLVGAGVITKFGVAYWSLSAFAIAAQVAMIALVFALHRRHFARRVVAEAIPAE
ncbi:hypothetical protein TA5114_03364 [Cognatishimia activa]|uniref:Uncharacterized protein n=1 Tax=Cognatishimia activa TaxID=1715691 RepID=A0A0N7MC89_9RHOB|nr:hypothetical protein [Cognatishimia activa]MEE2946039.1 hypothetical protein [Pseudomonadota bacterium]CUK27536.1 hypothetical protein TA5114_03364 [Cognatishimia activa]